MHLTLPFMSTLFRYNISDVKTYNFCFNNRNTSRQQQQSATLLPSQPHPPVSTTSEPHKNNWKGKKKTKKKLHTASVRTTAQVARPSAVVGTRCQSGRQQMSINRQQPDMVATAGGLSGSLRAVTEMYVSLPGCNLVIDSLYCFNSLCV